MLEWQIKNLEEIAEVDRGKFSIRPRNDPRFFGGEMPFVQTGDVTSAGIYLKGFSQTLNAEGVKVSKVFPKNTILITIAANIGECCLTQFDVACPDSVVGIVPKSDKVDPYWLLLSLKTKKDDLESCATQNAQKNINLQVLKPLKLLTPPLNEQREIAKILFTWDKSIEATERLLENSKKRKKALMQQLLKGKKRLPGFENHQWITVKANTVFKTVSIKRNSPDEPLLAVTQDQGAIPRDMLDRRVVMPDGETSGYKLVEPGNFIISLRSFQGGLEFSRYRGLVSPAYTILDFLDKKKHSPNFFRHYFKSYDFIGHLSVAVIGIRDGKQISYDDFSFLKIPAPSIEEQEKIASFLDTEDRLIDSISRSLIALQNEKKSLMQQLLTGKKRVKVEEAA